MVGTAFTYKIRNFKDTFQECLIDGACRRNIPEVLGVIWDGLVYTGSCRLRAARMRNRDSNLRRPKIFISCVLSSVQCVNQSIASVLKFYSDFET